MNYPEVILALGGTVSFLMTFLKIYSMNKTIKKSHDPESCPVAREHERAIAIIETKLDGIENQLLEIRKQMMILLEAINSHGKS